MQPRVCGSSKPERAACISRHVERVVVVIETRLDWEQSRTISTRETSRFRVSLGVAR